MAKKKNQTENVYIVDQELRPTVIGVVDETEKKPIFLIVIFIILVLVLFGLPYLTDMYTNLKSGTVSAPKTNTSNNNKKEENEVPQTSNDEPFYLMASNNPIKYDLVEISNLQFSQLNNKSYINFNLKNTSDKAFNITKQNYYLELYKE